MTHLKPLSTLLVLAITGCGEPEPQFNQSTETIARRYASPEIDKSGRRRDAGAGVASQIGEGQRYGGRHGDTPGT